MKKNIALLISFIALISLLLFLRVSINNNHKKENSLNGTLIVNALYGYDLKTDNLNVNGLVVKDQEVYYLLMETTDEENGLYNYQLKKLNIYDNEITAINSLENINSYCTLKEEAIYCLGKSTFNVYDFNFNEIFSYTKQTENENVVFLPFKDIYIKLEGHQLNLIINNTEETYRQIDSNINLYYEDYFLTNDNTFIILSNEEQTKYLYNVNENTLTCTNKNNSIKYAKGFVFYDDKKIDIYDLANSKKYEYDFELPKNYFYTGTLSSDNETLYLYDLIDNKILIENLKLKTMQELDVTKIAEENPIASTFIDEHYLYIYVLQDINNFYVLDLANLNLPSINLTEYNEKTVKNIDNKIKEIKEKYNVNINIKEEAVIDFPDFTAEVLTNNDLILESLTKIESILNKYDKELFTSFYNNGYDGLNIYLTGTLTPSNYETQVSNPAAYSLMYQKKYMIAIDLNQSNIEELICHELLHNLEFNLNNSGIYPFSNWNNYNPINFTYDDSYTEDIKNNYTILEENSENVYFIDYYSHTYDTEDRARIFENICACSENSIVKDYPNLYKKAIYLKEELTKYYPILNNTSLFNSLN